MRASSGLPIFLKMADEQTRPPHRKPHIVPKGVNCALPGPDDTVADPAAGTGGFRLAAHKYVLSEGSEPGLSPWLRPPT
jgi:hypothetical protein